MFNDCPICGKELITNININIVCASYTKYGEPHYAAVRDLNFNIIEEIYDIGPHTIYRVYNSTKIAYKRNVAYNYLVIDIPRVLPFSDLTEEYIAKLSLLI